MKIINTFEQFVQDQNVSASEIISDIDSITRNTGIDELEKYKDTDVKVKKPKEKNYKMPGSEKIKKKKEDEE